MYIIIIFNTHYDYTNITPQYIKKLKTDNDYELRVKANENNYKTVI